MTVSAPKVYAAMVGVMEDIGKEGISKARKNEQQGYKFRGIDDVYNELNRLLAKHHLLMLPTVVKDEQTERQTPRGGTLFFTRLTVDFKLVCADDGSSEIVRTIGEAMDSGDKSTNKAQSAAYKYAAMQVFCIPTEGDNDADAKTHEVAPKAKPEKRDLTHHPMGDDFPGCEGKPVASSYAAKKNGMGELFQLFQTEISELATMSEIGAFIKERTAQIQEMPEAWRKILREKLDEQKHEISRLVGANEDAA